MKKTKFKIKRHKELIALFSKFSESHIRSLYASVLLALEEEGANIKELMLLLDAVHFRIDTKDYKQKRK